jgi:acyl-CoA synthetase (AMP-forming)/AMP-acid ligase II
LHQWTQKSPNAVSLAERSGQGWREVRYAELLDQVGTVASSLLARGLGPETAIAIICGNSVDQSTNIIQTSPKSSDRLCPEHLAADVSTRTLWALQCRQEKYRTHAAPDRR